MPHHSQDEPERRDGSAKRVKLHHAVDNTKTEPGVLINHLVIHQVSCSRDASCHELHSSLTWFLDQPRLRQGDNKTTPLRGVDQVYDLESFIDGLNDIAFVVTKTYDCVAYHRTPEVLSKFQRITTAEVPTTIPSSLRALLSILVSDTHGAQPMKEQINTNLCSADFLTAMDVVRRTHPDLRRLLHRWDSDDTLTAPYLHFYHARKYFRNAFSQLDSASLLQVNTLLSYLDVNFGAEYDEADSLFQRGYFTEHHFQKLFAPGDVVVVQEEGRERAMTTMNYPDGSSVPITLQCEAWTFDGAFKKTYMNTKVGLPRDYEQDEEIPITSLAVVPLRFEATGLEQRLRHRGEFFWTCRQRRLVTYVAERRGFDIQVTNPRYMIDMETYNLMHAEEGEAENQAEDEPQCGDLRPEEMSADDPPPGAFVLLLPATIKAFRFHDKKWKTLAVEHLREVTWNREAFRKLVLKEENKKHIQALVQNHMVNSSSADIIESKGNGLVILLHGPPGTGKTLSAESVAEFSGRPLYRLTSGDIGTDLETVEKSLEQIFYLGTIWKAVVLLDECEVFMEERSPTDLKRNALVSVFLRALEYYDGILILTSNRVGTFDEAFKSRMHLAMYYPPLSVEDRNEIWLIFFKQLAEEKEVNKGMQIDIKDLMINSSSLASSKLNGRQIRNAIQTASKVALFEGVPFSSRHIRRTIKLVEEFESYVEGTLGQSSEERAELNGIRPQDPKRAGE